jgi:hypothetical protein
VNRQQAAWPKFLLTINLKIAKELGLKVPLGAGPGGL